MTHFLAMWPWPMTFWAQNFQTLSAKRIGYISLQMNISVLNISKDRCWILRRMHMFPSNSESRKHSPILDMSVGIRYPDAGAPGPGQSASRRSKTKTRRCIRLSVLPPGPRSVTCPINTCSLWGSGYNYDSTLIRLRFDRHSIPIRVQFDRVHYDHSTTYVATVGVHVVGCCTEAYINKLCAWRHVLCLRPLQIDNIFIYIRQVAPVPACWLFKTSATSWPLIFWPWKWCPSHV